MLIINAMDLVALGLGAVGLAAFCIVFLFDRVVHAMKERQQKRIDEAFEESDDK